MQGNKPPEEPKRDEKGRLLPGSTANPSGRSAIAKEMREYMAKFTKESIDDILKIAADPSVEAKERLKARTWLVEQVIGRATQAITGEDGGPVRLDAGVVELLRKLAA